MFPEGITSRSTCCWMLALCAFVGKALAGPQLTVIPAWDGKFVPGNPSEVRLHLVPQSGGPFSLTLSTPGWSSRHEGVMEAETEYRISLPVYPQPGKPVDISLQQEGISPVQQSVEFSPIDRPITAEVRSGGGFSPPIEAVELALVDIHMLPRTAEGYGGVSSIEIPPELLTQLTTRQLKALDYYLGDCRTLILHGGDERVAAVIRSHAGCGGRSIKLSPASGIRPENPLPSRPALENLLPADGEGYTQIAGFYLAGYAILLILALLTLRRATALVSVPLIGSLAIPALAYLGQTEPHVVSWVETESGDPSGRYAMLIKVEGSRSQQLQMPLPDLATLPTTDSAPPMTVILSNDQNPKKRWLQLDTRPFTKEHIRLVGNFRLQQPLSLVSSASGTLVTNTGGTSSPAALLVLEGELHQIPPLPPSAHWMPSEESRSDRQSRLISLFKARAGVPSLLVPFTLPFLPSDQFQQANGWLLIRAGKRA